MAGVHLRPMSLAALDVCGLHWKAASSPMDTLFGLNENGTSLMSDRATCKLGHEHQMDLPTELFTMIWRNPALAMS
jgi:hypothetical protein